MEQPERLVMAETITDITKLILAEMDRDIDATFVCSCENPLFLLEWPDKILCSECLLIVKELKWIKRDE